MALAPCTPTLPSDSPVVASWIASQASALHKGAKLREIIRGRDAAGAFARVVAWRAGGAPSLRVDGGEYGGDADLQGEATPDAVRQVLARRAVGATWEDPREVRAPSTPGVWLHAAGRTAFSEGNTMDEIARRGLVWLVREDGNVCGASPELLDRARRGGAVTWGPPPAAVGAEWVLASGLHRDELSSPTWPTVLAALERWADAAAVLAAGAPSVPAAVKVGDRIAPTGLPAGAVVRVTKSDSDYKAVLRTFERGYRWLVQTGGRILTDHSGGCSSVATWADMAQATEVEVLALGVPAGWSAASARVLAGVQPRASAMSWRTVPEDHLARTARGEVAWKRAGHAGRLLRSGVGQHLYIWGADGATDEAAHCEGLGSWTPLTGPHATPEEADEARRLLLAHGRLEPDPAAQVPQDEAPRTLKVGAIVRTPDEARALPPGAVLLEGEGENPRDYAVVLPDRTALYLRRSTEGSIAGTPRALAQGWASEQILEGGPASVVALADPARLGDASYMRGLLGWPEPAQAAPAATTAGPGIRAVGAGTSGPIEVKGFVDDDFATSDGPALGAGAAGSGLAVVRVTLDPGGAKSLADALTSVVGPKPGAVVPWAQVPPSSLSLDLDDDPVWRLSDGRWRRLAFGLGRRWTELSSSLEPAAQQPLGGERCKIVRVGVADDAALGDLVGWAAASGLAPDAARAIEYLPPEERARASAHVYAATLAAVVGAPQGPAPVADRVLARAREVLGDGFARRLAAPSAGLWPVGDACADWYEVVLLDVLDGRARMHAGCSCVMCRALPEAAWTDLPAEGQDRALELVRLVVGVPSVAARLVPWGTVQAVLAASPAGARPQAWPVLASCSAEGAPLLAALAGERKAGGVRGAQVGALRLDEVEPWTWEACVARSGAEMHRLAALAGRRVFALSAADALGVLAKGTPFASGGDKNALAQRASVLSLAQWDAAVDSDAFAHWHLAGFAQCGRGVRAYVVAGGEALLALPAGGWLRVSSRGTGLVVVSQSDPAPGAAVQAAAHAARVVRQQARKCAAWDAAPGACLTYAIVDRDGRVLGSSGAGPRVIE